MKLRFASPVTLRSLTFAVSLVLIGAAACSKPAEKAEPAPAPVPVEAAPVEAAPVEVAPAVDTTAPVETAAPVEATTTEAAAPVTTEAAAPAATPAPTAVPAAVPAAAPKAAAVPPSSDEVVILETAVGNITIDLYEDKCPLHAANFKKLVKEGYYNGSPFHRVIEGFMAQGGGKWGPGNQPVDVGYTVPAEIDRDLSHRRGTVAGARLPDQANPKRESSGSQFYICFGATPWLDGQYSIFGEVIAGMENVDKITKGAGGSGSTDPATATVITKARLAPKK